MKTRTRSRIYLSMAAMMLTATVAVPTAARQVPFKGAFSGQDTVSPGPSATELLDTAARGTGTHLGQFSLAQVLTVNVANHTATGSARWIAGQWRLHRYDSCVSGRTVGRAGTPESH